MAEHCLFAENVPQDEHARSMPKLVLSEVRRIFSGFQRIFREMITSSNKLCIRVVKVSSFTNACSED